MLPTLLFAVIPLFAAELALAPLPEGNNGIAAQFPGDSGITGSGAVVFADDFEGYSSAAGLSARWNGGVYHYVDFVTSGPNLFAGSKSLRFRNPLQTAELSNTVDRLLSTQLDVLFLRYYSKFDATFDVVGSSHNGSSISASYFVNGNATPGVPANGYNKFLANLECWRGQVSDPAAGFLNVYIYHPAQRDIWGDHFFPTGVVLPWTYLPGDFGADFTPRPDTAPELDRWYCYEIMVKANTPGDSDGRIACWLDGKLAADFPNLRLRDTDTLKIDRFGISCHIKSNTVSETYKYYDNVVAATSYIGPMVRTAPAVERRPGLLRKGTAEFTLYDIRGCVVRCFSGSYDPQAGLPSPARGEKGLPAGLYVWGVRQGNVNRVMKTVMFR
jgi:hypothetical protein